VDGVLVERNVGDVSHSALQAIVVGHVGDVSHSALQAIVVGHVVAFRKQFNLAVRPSCRLRTEETRYRVPDILVMSKPFRRAEKAIFEVPVLVIEVLSPDDRMEAMLNKLREYEKLGVRHIILMDPEDRTTAVFVNGNLVLRDLSSLDLPGGGSLRFDSRQLLSQIDEE
jgi:Uma2 family endonuclease